MHPLKTQKTNVFRARKSEDSTCHMCQCQILDLSVSDKQMICVETLEGGKTPKYTTFLALRIKPCNILRAKVRFLKKFSRCPSYLPSEQVGGQISHLPTAKLNCSTSYHAVVISILISPFYNCRYLLSYLTKELHTTRRLTVLTKLKGFNVAC